jgi:hypothetical protein
MDVKIVNIANVNIITAEVTMFSDSNCFCGNPRAFIHFWDDKNEVRLSVGDQDDLDIAVLYTAKDKTEAHNIFHELMNYLNDVEHAVIDSNTIFTTDKSIGSFFPDLGCPRRYELGC